jgi:diguanylate cyclase (GGDEF)-like protein/PAS domain S-box-containing protein
MPSRLRSRLTSNRLGRAETLCPLFMCCAHDVGYFGRFRGKTRRRPKDRNRSKLTRSGNRNPNATCAAANPLHTLVPGFRPLQGVARGWNGEGFAARSAAAERPVVQALGPGADGPRLDPDGHVRNWNSGAQHIEGYTADEIIGEHFSRFYTPEDLETDEPRRALETALRTGRYEREGWRVRKDRSRFWASVVIEPIRDDDGAHIGFAKVIRDITDRKEAEARIDYLAHHDTLTGLPNRALLADRLSQGIRYVARKGGSLAVLALDLDRFTIINDTFGHALGDRLIATVAGRLQNAVRAIDTVARVGGDEFAIVQVDVKEPNGAHRLARRLIDGLSQPFDFDGQEIAVSVSVGVALYPQDGSTDELLLKRADAALYTAKADGGSGVRFFEPEMDARIRHRHRLETDLRHAIGTGQITLSYQPQLACATGAITGFEALLRWQHPVHGAVAPADFIPIAEETGLIVGLGRWVIEQACATAAGWGAPLRVAVNLSPAQFRGPDLPSQISEILRRTGLPADRLELEVTETLLTNAKQALAILQRLRAQGIHITLDDFGTGYASLNHLRSFPFEKLKIDQSFVQHLGSDRKALSLVKTIVALAQNLDLTVVAEGVETDQQFEILRGLGCGEVQGFLFGRAMPPEDIERYLHHHRQVGIGGNPA